VGGEGGGGGGGGVAAGGSGIQKAGISFGGSGETGEGQNLVERKQTNGKRKGAGATEKKKEEVKKKKKKKQNDGQACPGIPAESGLRLAALQKCEGCGQKRGVTSEVKREARLGGIEEGSSRGLTRGGFFDCSS